MKILMVCLGNICRSPLAEGILRSKTKHLNIEVDSAGTSAYHIDEAPDARMIKTARKYGINISGLRGRQFKAEDFERFDKIYVMDKNNYDDIVTFARHADDISKIDYILNELEPGSNDAVPDPYFGGDEGFENVYKLLDEATNNILTKLGHGNKY